MKTVFVSVAVFALGLLGLWLWTPDRARTGLEAAYLQSPDDMIEIAGTRLHVRDDGPEAAPAVIMVHGFGASLHTWEPWAEALAGDFRVVRFDLPGSGLSPPDPTGVYTDERSIELILALMDDKGLDRASVIGNSIGGRIAWTLAARHPDRVDRLVLIAPDGFASRGFAYGEPAEVPAVLSLMRYVLPPWLVRPTLEDSYGDPSRLGEDTFRRYYDLLLAPGARGANLARLRQTVLTDPRPLLRGLKRPVLLVWGEKDRLIPVENAEDYLAALPDARAVTFPDLGHVPHEEAPKRTLRPVRAFLAGQGSSGSQAP
ncbi:MAG: alpha/beta fold hydrolase [Alphaproteobacteria bacterium]